MIDQLRKLADQQDYENLQQQAFDYWQQEQSLSALVLTAIASANLGQLHKAEQFFVQAAQQTAAMDMDTSADFAVLLILKHDLDGAISLLASILKQQADHALALARIGYAYMLKSDWDAAIGYFKHSLEVAPHRVLVCNNLASVYIYQQQFDEAQNVIEQGTEQLDTLKATLPEATFEQQKGLLSASQLQLWVSTSQFEKAEAWLTELEQQLEQSEMDEDTFVGWLLQYGQLLSHQDLHDQASDIVRSYLKKFPKNVQLLTRLADLAQIQGSLVPALTLLRRAIKIIDNDDDKSESETIELWVKLSSVALHKMDKHARKAAEKANELAQALEESITFPAQRIEHVQLQAKNALAQVELHEENFEASEKIFNEILTLREYFVPALQGLGQQHMQQGNIDEAMALFEKIKQVDPIKGSSVLINARKFPEDEETLEKMERAANQPTLEGKSRSGILFQLASAWEKRKDYDKAFELAKRANDASKRFLPYDAKKHRNACARTRHSFSKSLYDHRKDCGVDSSLPVYVLGMPRSGTTLVEQILSGHSEIFGAGELGVIPQVIQGLNRWERHTGSGRKYPDCIDDLTPYTTEGIANNVLRELQEYSPESKHIVDKLPHNFENIGLIKFLFPNAKIISVRRDPRDIAMSNYFTDYQAKHGGMGFAYDLTSIGEQLADHNLFMHYWHEIFPGEILELNYEDVVDDLEGSARKMLDYIGVDWEPEVLKFNELDRTVKTASVWQVRQPIYKSSKAKWKRYESHLAPLIKGTNAKIEFDPIDDMITLPEPGLLQQGVEHYRNSELREAETCFKKLLHHNPDHAAANYMVGLVYCSIGEIKEAIPLIEKALDKCPWHKDWRKNLARAYSETGQEDKVDALKLNQKDKEIIEEIPEDNEWPDLNDERIFDGL